MAGGAQVPVRRSVPRAAVLATALSVVLLVALLAEARSTPDPVLVPDRVSVDPAAGGGCPPLVPAGRDLRVMFVGDSMTQGRSGSATYRYWVWRGLTDPVSAGGAGRDDVTFVGPRTGLNGTAADAEAYEHLDHGFAEELAHAGQAGATFASSRDQDPPARLVAEHRPDVVVLQLGYNDANRSARTPEELADRFTAYVEAMWEVEPATRFVVGQIPPAEGSEETAGTTAERNRRTAATNDLLQERWSAEPCRVQVNRLRSASELAWDPAVHSYDGAHPDPAGETLMADRMLAALGRIGVFDGEVHVHDPAEEWEPGPRPVVDVTADGLVRVDWSAERERLSATGLRLRIGTVDDYRRTAWTDDDVLTVDLGSGVHELRAVVRRGLPGRMLSEPGEPVTVTVR